MRGLRSWAIWWLVLFGLWNILQGAWEAMEIAAGAGAAALAATFAELARRQGLLAFSPDLGWPARVFRQFWRLPYEFGVVTVALVLDVFGLRSVRSQWSTYRLPSGRAAPIRDGNCASVLVAENVSPNTMAVEAEDGTEALAHALVPGRGTSALPS
jgi:hypothetical protein